MNGLGTDWRVPQFAESRLILTSLTGLCGGGLQSPLGESNIGVDLLAENWLAEGVGGAEAEARGHGDGAVALVPSIYG